ncbi:MAG TPA: TlyA family RNA methyltransferase [Candidatus Limnocylindrales bacterium]|nr:TlyA family RNA methyltransferase [Candidatus Limnocylindrales bacterium]
MRSRRQPISPERSLASRVRADDRLVALGLADTRAEAARLVLAGLVLEGTRRIDKAGEQVAIDAALTVRARGRFVSRGGDKLDAALEHFRIDVEGAICLDAGCSTGGFTDCLLQRGAARVYAVDVGYGQFAWSLRGDPRVVLMERTNVRSIDPALLEPRPNIVVADLSFVSLAAILPSLIALAAPAARFVLLVKPQFEVAATDTDRGVVVSEEVRLRALESAVEAARKAGLHVIGTIESPLRGAQGNVEYLLAASRER